MEMPFPSPHQKRHWTRTPSKTFVFAPCSGVHNAILAVIWPPGTWRHPKWPHATPQVAAFKTARERQRALSETGEMGENREKNAPKLWLKSLALCGIAYLIGFGSLFLYVRIIL